MSSSRWTYLQKLILFSLIAVLPVVLAALLVSCGAVSYGTQSSGTGTINLSMTDPPTCQVPNGNFQHIYVTIRSVEANINATADDNSSGWQELAPRLNSQPMQIDLFSTASTTCLLTTLGSNAALPAGTYQQIRVLLVPNSGGTGPTSATNNCGSQGFNCVVLADSSIHELDLSSQANTGLKIPPGQIVGGPISVAAGQDVDLNIDFNACASIIQEGNGQYRLKPVLTAEQVSTNNTGISGQVVKAGAAQPILGGTVIVALEKQDNTGTDVIFEQADADSSGNFNFCPLPSGATFDVVVVAIDGSGVAYNATVAAGVPGGTNLGAIPLIPETGTSTGPATFQGNVTASTAAPVSPASVDVLVSAIQIITVSGGASLPVTIPTEGISTTNLSLDSSTGCPTTAPANTNCAQYTLIEPASNPSVGIFTSGKVASYSAPAAGDVLFSIRANAFVPLSGGTTDCTPSSITINQDSSTNPLKALPGPPITPKEIDFSGCS
jgi:Domain of unknown function (DUF4382)